LSSFTDFRLFMSLLTHSASATARSADTARTGVTLPLWDDEYCDEHVCLSDSCVVAYHIFLLCLKTFTSAQAYNLSSNYLVSRMPSDQHEYGPLSTLVILCQIPIPVATDSSAEKMCRTTRKKLLFRKWGGASKLLWRPFSAKQLFKRLLNLALPTNVQCIKLCTTLCRTVINRM